ncbi:hypothetical protein [Flavobacterium anhuiense]|uniref:hypothetical protein n=1 Tax=Flavobacterium anhuiense TaxID=459526 RepID=UPI003D99C1DF
MKTVLRKIIILIVLLGLLSSCKKNDGYSDEIETVISPLDSGENKIDSVKNENHISTGIKSTQKNGSESTVGTGSGPSESPQDGALYTPATGVQKDSVKAKKDSLKRKKK